MDQDNWFSTGDVASIDPLGYMRITDRSKDVFKSGGVCISSIEIEIMAVSHEQVHQLFMLCKVMCTFTASLLNLMHARCNHDASCPMLCILVKPLFVHVPALFSGFVAM